MIYVIRYCIFTTHTLESFFAAEKKRPVKRGIADRNMTFANGLLVLIQLYHEPVVGVYE